MRAAKTARCREIEYRTPDLSGLRNSPLTITERSLYQNMIHDVNYFLNRTRNFFNQIFLCGPGWIGGGYITAVTATSPVGYMQKKQIDYALA